MSDDDLPAILTDQVRNTDAEAWLPISGPLDWEERTHGELGEWSAGDPSETNAENALVIRDGFNTEEWIISTVYAPDLMRML